ncbi:unnamed protein product, partial [Rotaria magnacalcarata]
MGDGPGYTLTGSWGITLGAAEFGREEIGGG